MAIYPEYYLLDACSGSGMLGEAVKIALADAVQTICYVEQEARAAANLVARMADSVLDQAPIWSDVATMPDQEFLTFIRQFRGRPLILTAGYPCQPFSLAGRRAGEHDPRHLWRSIDRFIGAAMPELVFLENVPGHLSLGFGTVRGDLEARGYRVAQGLFSAAEVGAAHRRERLFILAVANTQREPSGLSRPEPERQRGESSLSDAGGTLGDSDGARELEQDWNVAKFREWAGDAEPSIFCPGPKDRENWKHLLRIRPDVEPAICRTSHGMAVGVDSDRLRLTGNGVVPLAAAYAFLSLAAGFSE